MARRLPFTSTMTRVLIPFDMSPLSLRALELVASAFPQGPGAHIEAVMVVDDSTFPEEFWGSTPGLPALMHAEVQKVQRRHPDAAITERIVYGTPWREIVAHAEEAEFIAMGARAHGGLAEWALGRTAVRVLRHSSASVLLLKQETPALPRRILCAVDLASEPLPLLREAQRVQALAGAELSLVHFIDEGVAPAYLRSTLDHYWTRLAQSAREELAGIAQKAGFDAAVSTEVVRGHLRESVPTMVTRSGFDLVVVGSHQHAPIERMLLGSFAETLVESSPCDVLVVRK